MAPKMPPFTFYHSICTSAPFLCLPNSFGSPSCCNMPKKNKCICSSNKEEKIVPSKGGGYHLVPCFWWASKCAAPVGKGPLGLMHPACLLALGLFALLGDYQTRFEEELAVFLQKRCLKYKYVQTLLDIFPSPTTTRPWPKTPFTPIKFTQDETPHVSFSDRIMRIILTAVQRIDSSKSLEDLADSSEFNGSLQGLWVCLYSEDRYTVMREITNDERASCLAVHADSVGSESTQLQTIRRLQTITNTRHTRKGVKSTKTCHEFIQLNSRRQTRYSIRNVL